MAPEIAPEVPVMLPLSTDADTASLWWAYVDRYVTRRSGAEAALAEVIEADPGLAVARAAALLMIGLDAADFDPAETTATARRGRADHDWERSFTEATLTTHSQGMWPARPAWERHQQRFPADLIGLSIAVFLTLTSTEPDAEDRALAIARTSADAVGEHPVLVGFEAMTAQDQGRLDDAHRLALRALELDPTGFSGGHPLAHVFFESGDHAGGIAWLDDWLPTTDQEASFGCHLVWHSALHHLAVGDGPGALERYHHCAGRPGAGAVVDGTSMLWRCQIHGLVPHGTDPSDTPVGPLLTHLVDAVPSTFVGVHVALGLATARDAEGLRRLAASARSFTRPRRSRAAARAGPRPGGVRRGRPCRRERPAARRGAVTSSGTAGPTPSARSSRTPCCRPSRWPSATRRRRPGCRRGWTAARAGSTPTCSRASPRLANVVV